MTPGPASHPLGQLLPLLGVSSWAPEHSASLHPPRGHRAQLGWRTALYTAGAQSLQADQGRSGGEWRQLPARTLMKELGGEISFLKTPSSPPTFP